MIVNYLEDGWQIISQRAHGLLAGEICFHWKKELRPPRWLETIVATTEHDDAFSEFDDDNVLLNENGGPVNYKMRKFDKEKCDQLIRHALTKSRYIALLTSRHIQFLYENSEDKEARKFVKEIRKLGNIWMKEIGIKEDEVSKAYSILEWCDAFSLLICQQLVQPENRKIEISSGPDNLCYQLHAPSPGQLNVEPWPFEADAFQICYESKTISQLKFKNVKEFRKQLMNAPIDLHVYKICKN
jgi:hypothetical protein